MLFVTWFVACYASSWLQTDIVPVATSYDMDAKKPAEPPVAELPSDPAPSDQGNKRDKELDEVLEELRSVKGKLQQLEKRLELLRK